MVATKGPRKYGRPGPFTSLAMIVMTAFMILGFQNCAVDLSSTTPGASTSGACSPSTADLATIQPAATYLKNNCASCHSVSGGGSAGFYVPEASADVSQQTIQSFTYTNLCARGGKDVGLKIDGTKTHGGPTGVSRTTGDAVPFYNYLNERF